MAATAVIFFLVACQNSQAPDFKNAIKTNEDLKKRISYYNAHIYPQLLQHITPGDIIARMGTDLTSEIIANTNPIHKDLSHCGVVLLEKDSFYVYHTIGGPWNPDGKMKRESLHEFAWPASAKSVALFSVQIDKSAFETFIAKIMQWYEQGILFDMDFDWDTSDRMYCTELIAKALIAAIGNDVWLPKVIYQDKIYVPLENLCKNDRIQEKWRSNY